MRSLRSARLATILRVADSLRIESKIANDVNVALKALTELRVKTIVRLNEHLYESSFFTRKGLHHYDLVFPDGSVPNKVNVKVIRT